MNKLEDLELSVKAQQEKSLELEKMVADEKQAAFLQHEEVLALRDAVEKLKALFEQRDSTIH